MRYIFVQEDNQTYLTSCVAKQLQVTECQNSVDQLLNSSVQTHHTVYGCGTKTLLLLTQFWLEEMKGLRRQGIPKRSIINGFKQAVTLCINRLDPVTVTLEKVKHQVQERQVQNESVQFPKEHRPSSISYKANSSYVGAKTSSDYELSKGKAQKHKNQENNVKKVSKVDVFTKDLCKKSLETNIDNGSKTSEDADNFIEVEMSIPKSSKELKINKPKENNLTSANNSNIEPIELKMQNLKSDVEFADENEDIGWFFEDGTVPPPPELDQSLMETVMTLGEQTLMDSFASDLGRAKKKPAFQNNFYSGENYEGNYQITSVTSYNKNDKNMLEKLHISECEDGNSELQNSSIVQNPFEIDEFADCFPNQDLLTGISTTTGTCYKNQSCGKQNVKNVAIKTNVSCNYSSIKSSANNNDFDTCFDNEDTHAVVKIMSNSKNMQNVHSQNINCISSCNSDTKDEFDECFDGVDFIETKSEKQPPESHKSVPMGNPQLNAGENADKSLNEQQDEFDACFDDITPVKRQFEKTKPLSCEQKQDSMNRLQALLKQKEKKRDVKSKVLNRSRHYRTIDTALEEVKQDHIKFDDERSQIENVHRKDAQNLNDENVPKDNKPVESDQVHEKVERLKNISKVSSNFMKEGISEKLKNILSSNKTASAVSSKILNKSRHFKTADSTVKKMQTSSLNGVPLGKGTSYFNNKMHRVGNPKSTNSVAFKPNASVKYFTRVLESLVSGLSHNNEEFVDSLCDVIKSQMSISEMEHEDINDIRLDLNRVHTLSITGSLLRKCAMFEGLVIKTTTEQMGLIDLSQGRERKCLLINGDLSSGFKHKGYKQEQKVKVHRSSLPMETKENRWLEDLTNLFYQLSVQMILVKGTVDGSIIEICRSKDIIVVSGVTYKVLQAVGEATGASIATYVQECTQENVCGGVHISALRSDWMDVWRKDNTQQFAVINIPSKCPIQSVVFSHPIQSVAEDNEEIFWHSASRVLSALRCGKVLLGAGKTESHCYYTLNDEADNLEKNEDNTENDDSNLPVVYRSVAKGFLSFYLHIQKLFGLAETLTNIDCKKHIVHDLGCQNSKRNCDTNNTNQGNNCDQLCYDDTQNNREKPHSDDTQTYPKQCDVSYFDKPQESKSDIKTGNHVGICGKHSGNSIAEKSNDLENEQNIISKLSELHVDKWKGQSLDDDLLRNDLAIYDDFVSKTEAWISAMQFAVQTFSTDMEVITGQGDSKLCLF